MQPNQSVQEILSRYKKGDITLDEAARVIEGFRLEHVGVDNATAVFPYPKGEFKPCVVVDMTSPADTGTAIYNGRPFRKFGGNKQCSLYAEQSR